jgi:hypothetical protein
LLRFLCCNWFMAAKCMKKQITSDDWLNGNHVFNDIGFNATWRVVREDVCTYLRALGNVRTGKYQHFQALQKTRFLCNFRTVVIFILPIRDSQKKNFGSSGYQLGLGTPAPRSPAGRRPYRRPQVSRTPDTGLTHSLPYFIWSENHQIDQKYFMHRPQQEQAVTEFVIQSSKFSSDLSTDHNT